MKAIAITVTQEPGGESFRVKSFTNTSELRVGQVVSAAQVDRWVNSPDLRHVTVAVVGLTPEKETQAQPSLFEAPAKPAPRRGTGRDIVASK